MSEKQEIYELIRDSDILCDDCGPHGPTYCAEALAELLTSNGYRKAVVIEPLKRRGFRAWLRRFIFRLRARRLFNRLKRLRLEDIDEMHKHHDADVYDALKLGLGKLEPAPEREEVTTP